MKKPDSGHSESWRPSASLDDLKARASLLADIRSFFSERGVLEVETPALSHAATTDPAIESFVTQHRGPASGKEPPLYLHTSPEFPMKRLLAAGSGSIYQICKVFRSEEYGRLHNPEFTLLEWYRTGYDYHEMMDELENLVSGLLEPYIQLGSSERRSYAEVFQVYAGINPHQADLQALKKCAEEHAVSIPVSMLEDGDTSSKDVWLDLLLTQIIGPRLGKDKLTFLYDYPASQASLAKIRQENENGGGEVAERFELYLKGVELANGFHELQDHNEQAKRFKAEVDRRISEGRPAIPQDEYLLEALEHGLPQCSGVAMGLDRLLMLATGHRSLREVIAFPFDRA